ncbi:MAG: hypothetical protein U5J83_00890 [Bryobacterales bacterium]|nr:hypothetical protein [Bryobacterales bacterium]
MAASVCRLKAARPGSFNTSFPNATMKLKTHLDLAEAVIVNSRGRIPQSAILIAGAAASQSRNCSIPSAGTAIDPGVCFRSSASIRMSDPISQRYGNKGP